MTGGDPIDALRAAWRDLGAPPADRQLEREDPAVQAAVRLLRRAWRDIEIPPAAPPRRRAARARGALARIACAAAVLLAAGLFVARSDRESAPMDAEESPTALPLVVCTTSDRTEMRVGNVRLILLNQPEPRVPATEKR